MLRVAAPGQLQRLEDAFDRHREVEPRVLPCRFQPYRRGCAIRISEPPVSVFSDDWIVLRRVEGPRLPMTRVVSVAKALRGALLAEAGSSPPEELSGHAPDGVPATHPHAAFLPLPFVAHRHADGTLLGVAIVLPRAIEENARLAILRALGSWEARRRREIEDEEVETPPLQLLLGAAGVLEVERVAWGSPPASLRPSSWCRPARLWLSATPIALDRNPGDLHDGDPARRTAAFAEAEAVVAKACENIGLPAPEQVSVVRSSILPGSEKPRRFPTFPSEAGKTRRVLVHARILFPEPVRGPVLLGAGRYFGLGLLRPMEETS